MNEKLKITPLPPSKLKEIVVMFNPNSYSVEKSVTWDASGGREAGETQRKFNAPALTFGGGGSRTLSLELFYDVTESADRVRDVRRETGKLVALTRIMADRKNPHPPVCKISWGSKIKNSDFPFTGVVTSLTQRFTLFSRTGEPLRATLNVSFREFLDPEKDLKDTDPELTTYVVKRGDTLAAIAAAVYGDPTQWRLIAEANRQDDPRRQQVGAVLTIPKKV
ncbi:MAG: LysM peptidoglycan-binding domain-containing protein [Pyrinomonadaceae bacterium]